MSTFLETDRLVLRRFTEDDVEDLVELNGDPEVMRFINGGTPIPRDVIERQTLPAYLRSYDRCQGCGYWAAIERSTGRFLGWISLVPDGSSTRVLQLGYRLCKTAWGKGYAAEGALALIQKAFSELGAQRVTASTYEDNVSSRRVMERVGMRLVRTFRLTPEDLLTEDGSHTPSEELWDGDDVEYAIERGEWEQLPGAG